MGTKKSVTIMFHIEGDVPDPIHGDMSDPIHWHWGELLGVAVADWWVDEGERTVHVGIDSTDEEAWQHGNDGL
jgi:hypothetical protein